MLWIYAGAWLLVLAAIVAFLGLSTSRKWTAGGVAITCSLTGPAYLFAIWAISHGLEVAL